MGSYVYIKTEPHLWTVGFYPGGRWEPESDYSTPEEAAARVHWLNGGKISDGTTPVRTDKLIAMLDTLVARGEQLGYQDEDYREWLAQLCADKG